MVLFDFLFPTMINHPNRVFKDNSGNLPDGVKKTATAEFMRLRDETKKDLEKEIFPDMKQAYDSGGLNWKWFVDMINKRYSKIIQKILENVFPGQNVEFLGISGKN